MQVLTESLTYRFFHILSVYYQNSCLKKLIKALAEVSRHSTLARWMRASSARESSFRSSSVFRLLKAIMRIIDRWMLNLSAAVSNWSEASFVTSISKDIIKASRNKMFALILPIFGMGYIVGRLLLKGLMIRDIFFLGFLFVFAGVMLMDAEKRKDIWTNSLLYQLCKLLLE